MALGDIWQLSLRSTMFNEDVLNVFHYEETTAETQYNPEDALSLYFEQDVLPLITPTTVNDITYLGADVKQITGGVAIGSRTYGTTGAGTGSALSQFIGWGFRYNRATAASRHGYKRFSGISEDAQDNGVATGAMVTALQALAAGLLIPLSDSVGSGDGSFTPRILSRYSGKQLRPTPLAFAISSVEYVGITTQNTRKR